MDSIEAYEAFSLMMQHRNFSAVARKMGIGQSTVSKHIAALEKEFQVQLFVRNTRRVSPTIEANRLNEQVEHLLDALKTVRATASGQAPDVDGQLKLSMPADFGRATIMPLVPEFAAEHPSLSLKITMVDGSGNRSFDNSDLAITTAPAQSNVSLIKRTLKTYPLYVLASAEYLATHGEPSSPLDLESRDVMAPSDFGAEAVDFDSDEGRQRIAVNQRIEIDDVPTIYDFAKRGLVIAILPSWIAGEELAAGTMKRILSDYYLPPVEAAVVYPPTSFLAPRTRLFIDFLVARLSEK